jgi:L-arabinose isomerase
MRDYWFKNRMGKSQIYIGHEDDSVAKIFMFNKDGDKLVTSLIRSGQEATLTMNGARNIKEQTMLTSRGISSGAAVMKSVAVLDSAGKLAALDFD